MSVWPDSGEGGAPIPPVALAMTNWIEAAFYGIYTALFFQYLITKFEYGIGQAIAGKVAQSKVYFVVTVLMYINGTAYSALSVYITTTLTNFEAEHTVDSAIEDASLAAGILTYVQLWLGDLLIVYRAHLVWDHDWRVTAIPWLTLLVTFVLLFTSATLQDPWQVSAALFLAVAQNFITSGLLVYRLVSQHSESTRAGLHRFSRHDGTLIRMAYIVSESAAMYLIVLVVYTVLFQLSHPAVAYLQVMLSSVAGIVLLAISVRFAGIKTGSAGGPSMTWRPPSEWRISVQFAPAAVESGSAHEETVDEEGERCIEMQHPSFSTKEESKRSSPAPRTSPPLTRGLRNYARGPSDGWSVARRRTRLYTQTVTRVLRVLNSIRQQSSTHDLPVLRSCFHVTTMAAIPGGGGGGAGTPAATLLIASWIEIHLIVTVLMYLNGTAYSVLSIFNTLGFLKAVDAPLDPSTAKASLAGAVMTYAQMWMGDFLIDALGLEWRLTRNGASMVDPPRELGAALFLAVAQNIITTGLVVYRLALQHSESSRARLHRFSKRSGALIRIAHIVSESAMVYLTVLVLYTAFYHLKHPGLLQLILSSTIGIVLLTISVRVAGLKSGSAGAGGSSMTWATPTEWQISAQVAPADDTSASAHDCTPRTDEPMYEQHACAGSKADN
ncbi:hypothetical protein HDZ31DRAFT_29130 [Schizophyllum fasciatum]